MDLVLVPVTVTDRQDRIVLGLEKDNFTVLEGPNKQVIRHFSSEDTPVSLGIIFDTSSSNVWEDGTNRRGGGAASSEFKPKRRILPDWFRRSSRISSLELALQDQPGCVGFSR